MEAKRTPFDESQSLEVIREMLAVSKKKLRNDALLMITWGWVLCYISTVGFIKYSTPLTFQTKDILDYIGGALVIGCLVFTIYYLYKSSKKVQTYIGVSLRYVWISLVISMMLVNVILFKVTDSVLFKLQHPIFMVFMANAVVVTGAILRNQWVIMGGIVFALLALFAANYEIRIQLLLESVAWVLALIIPGHLLYAKGLANRHVPIP